MDQHRQDEHEQEERVIRPQRVITKAYMVIAGLALTNQLRNLVTVMPHLSPNRSLMLTIIGISQARIHADTMEKYILHTHHQPPPPPSNLMRATLLLSSAIKALTNPSNFSKYTCAQYRPLQTMTACSDIAFNHLHITMLADYISSQRHNLLPRATLNPTLLMGIGSATALTVIDEAQNAGAMLSPVIPINMLYHAANGFCLYRALSDTPVNQNPARDNGSMFNGSISKIFALISIALMFYTLGTVMGFDSRSTWRYTFTAITQMALGGAFKKATPSFFQQNNLAISTPDHTANIAPQKEKTM